MFWLGSKQRPQDFIDCINDLREFDVPYHVRFAIDNGNSFITILSFLIFLGIPKVRLYSISLILESHNSDIRCGQWYDVSVSSAGTTVEKRTDLLQRAEVHVCAFDIETTKLPLKFPDAEYDSIMMISYMVDGQGYLIINREVTSKNLRFIMITNIISVNDHLYNHLWLPFSSMDIFVLSWVVISTLDTSPHTCNIISYLLELVGRGVWYSSVRKTELPLQQVKPNWVIFY